MFINPIVKNNENKYTKMYPGRILLLLAFDSKVYSLLNIKPNKAPDKKPIPAANAWYTEKK